MSSLSAKDRSRSPRFPSQALNDSLRHAELIYMGVHRSPIDSDSAYRLMGFSGKTGTSAKALGSLRQYGLIEGLGAKTRISDLALEILEPGSEREKAQALRKAARSPSVFEAILARFDDRVPQADEPIRAFLIRELGFQKGSADECIKSLRESLSFAEANSSTSLLSEENEKAAEFVAAEPPVVSSSHTRVDAETPTQSAMIPLTRECRAELKIFGPLTAKAVDNLIRHVELLKEVWAEDV